MEFVIANWHLFAGVAVVLALLGVTATGYSFGGLTQAAPARVVQMLNQENAVVFDLRSEEQYCAGHLVGAVNVSPANLATAMRKVTSPEKQPVVLVSERGVAVGAIVKELKQANVQQIIELKGGVAAWRDEQLPLVKS